jgi:uncharacterized protein (TIGR03663 family)
MARQDEDTARMSQASARTKKRRGHDRRASPGSNEKLISPQAIGPGAFRAWRWAAGCILATAAVLRLIYPNLKPLHHDEGVNGLFLTTLFRSGYYHYDPSNFHGPTLYYFGWITSTINSFFYGKDGLSTFAIRSVTALFGIGIVWLILCLRRQLGDFGALAAAAMAAVSPGFVFFSRYFIHEILFVFFTLGVVVAVLRFTETNQPRYLMLASGSGALLCATKETWVITVAVWLIALPCTRVYLRLRKMPAERQASPRPREPRKNIATPPQEPPAKRDWSRFQLYATAALLFVAVWVLFYSSFFTNFPNGVYDSVRTFGYWFKTSNSAHAYSWTKYLAWLWKAEAPVLILGAIGLSLAMDQAANRFAVFTAFWSAGILAAYCLVSYKTPWLALNIILPFIIMAGYGLEQLWQRRKLDIWIFGTASLRAWAVCAAVIAGTVSLYQAVDVSFFRYDDDRKPYVYAHTNRSLLAMVNEINSIAAGNAAGREMGITVMSPEHWPLPWYLRDYNHAAYFGKVVDSSEPLLIVHENQVAEVERKLGSKYRLIGSYDLRPGNRLFLYLRKDAGP